MKKYVAVLFMLTLLGTNLSHAEKFTVDTKTKKQVQNIMQSMTLAQKIGQLTLLDLSNEDPAQINQEKLAEVKALIKAGKVGAILNWRGAAVTNELQDLAKQHGAGVPILFAQDVIHGFRTVFPTPLAEAASWNLELAKKTAEIAAIEASAAGIRWTFAPMVDMSPDPRWGRIVEGAGEDPYLGSMLAKARVEGFQKDNRVAACAKHFVAYGAVMGARDYNAADVSEQQIYDAHFPPFQAAVDAGAMTMMSAFNTVNGVPATANKWILHDVLREQWGFEGFVVSDYNSVGELANHGVAPTGGEAVKLALNAGVEMDMEGKEVNPSTGAESTIRIYNQYLPTLIKNNEVSMQRLNEAVARILAVKVTLGLFDQSATSVEDEKNILQANLHPAHRKVALLAAQQSMVLLKNQALGKTSKALLPLPNDKNLQVAVIGPYANAQDQMLGPWSGPGRFPGEAQAKDVITILDGIQKRAAQSNIDVVYAQGLPLAQTLPGSELQQPDRSLWKKAIRAAKKADVVIAVLGEHVDASGEASSRTELNFPGLQEAFLHDVSKVNPNIVLLVASGRPLALEWEAGHIPSILQVWHPGVEAGHAVASIVFGDVNPSGKMPVTTVRNAGQVPMNYNALPSGRPRNGLTWQEVPWTHGYVQDQPTLPLFPFGYGLSYTEFEYSNLVLTSHQVSDNGTVTAKVTVRNKGDHDGTEIVQLYVHDQYGGDAVSRPVKELKAFDRVFLKKGQQKQISLEVPVSSLGFHKVSKGKNGFAYVVEPGIFDLWVGPNASQGLATTFEVVAAKK
ncbi:MAG: glycoside hydrolase family 3 N-terminal domain-containing protein [Bdellovibrionota bacterium]